MSDLVLGSTTVLSDSSGTPTIQSGVVFPAGHVLETKQTLYRGSVGVANSDGYYQPSGFEVTTTAKVANVKFLINYAVSLGMDASADISLGSGIFKDSDSDPLSETINSGVKSSQTKTSMHSAAYWNLSGNSQYQMVPLGGQYLYTSTLAKDASITFKIKIRQGDASNQVIYVNRSGSDNDATWMTRSVSQISVQQIMP